MNNPTISKRTIKSLRTAASKYFPAGDKYDRDNSPYHVWLGANFGVDSTLDLTDEQGKKARGMIDELLKDQRRAKNGKRTGNWMSADQRDYMDGLFADLDIPKGPRQMAFIGKQLGVAKSPDWLSPKEATKVITGLKRYKKSLDKEMDKRLNPGSDERINNESIKN